MLGAWKVLCLGLLAGNGAILLVNCSVEVKGGAITYDGGGDARRGSGTPDEPDIEGPDPVNPSHPPADGGDVGPRSRTVFAVDNANKLVRFSTLSPGAITATPITSIPDGETVQGIDFRPKTGVLYGFTSGSATGGKLYRIFQDIGKATLVEGDAGAGYPVILNTTAKSYGVDFDPVEDRLRITSNDGLGLRLRPDNGRSVNPTSDQPPTYSGGTVANVVGTAFTNNIYETPKRTTLYAIDSTKNVLLVFQGTLSDGNVKEVGPLGVDPSEVAGFDIYGGSELPDGGGVHAPLEAYAALTVDNKPGLYRIDLSSGAATSLGAIGHDAPLRGITLVIDRPQD